VDGVLPSDAHGNGADASTDGSNLIVQTMSIGTTGGLIDIEGATLVVPAGAVASDVQITITKTNDVAPPGVYGPSAVYQLGPEGQTFVQPVTFTLHLQSPPPAGYFILWSKAGVSNPTTEADYDIKTVTVSGSDVSATSTHFSKVFGGQLPST
jgi:hypothetical protein